MRQQKHLWVFLFILLVAAFLRLYRLGSIPPSLTWDEASIGYNAFAILTEHRDEWLVRTPLAFRSFGEYKAPVAIYLVALTIKVLGVTSFAIRLPMAIAGIIVVAASYWIGRALFPKRDHALLLMALVAVSPLNIHYSRIAFESTLSVAFVAVGTALLLHAARRPALYFWSAGAFVLSLYANHATKIVVPFLLLVLAIHCHRELWRQRKYVVLSVALAVVLLLPLARVMLAGAGGERFYMTSIVAPYGHLRPLPEILQLSLHNYGLHFDPRFLLFGQGNSYRDGNGMFGVLSVVEFLFIVVGLCALIVQPELRKKYWWLIPMILISILPAAISEQAPHSNRIHHIIPWIDVLAVVGSIFLTEHVFVRSKEAVSGAVITLVCIEAALHAWLYFTVFPIRSAPDYQYGYQQVISYLQSQENHVNGILVTDAYQQDYIYLLLAKKIPPIEYHQGGLNNYKVQPVDWKLLGGLKDAHRDHGDQGILIAGTPSELPFYVNNIVYEVLFPDGSVAFRVIRL